MRGLRVWTVGVIAAGVAIGCGPGKELPDDVPQAVESTGPQPDPLGPAPSASHPATRATLDRAVKAITENFPGGSAKAKVAVATYQVGIYQPSTKAVVKVVRTIESVWPDRARVTDNYKEYILTFLLRNHHGWLKQGPTVVPRAPVEVGRIIRADMTAQHWLLLGLPLTAAQTVAFDPATTPEGKTVKLGVADLPTYRVTFADATGLPVKVEYYPLEGQQRVHKVLTMSEHKPAGGLLLPAKIDSMQNDITAEQWALTGWEFPETIDPTKFDPPQQP